MFTRVSVVVATLVRVTVQALAVTMRVLKD